MAQEEPAEVAGVPADPIAWLRGRAPWLCAAELGTCLVGSAALAHACRAAGVAPPTPGDLDLSWSPDPAAGRALLEQRGVFQPTTAGNVARGTLALRLDGHRIEITTHRGRGDGGLEVRIAADLAERDMTIGALAVELATGRVHDPHGGLADWRRRRIAAVGAPADRVREHPVRWLRYHRKAHELDFELDGAVRGLGRDLDAAIVREVPAEALALELRALLDACRSPGQCLLDLFEAGLLEPIAPELARQFDGRPAGPPQWHPEGTQARHLILALEWAVARTHALPERDRLAVRLAVLCHDLGKGYTPEPDWPRHIGHEGAGVAHVDRLLDRLPGLADQRARTLARHVCALHLAVRRIPKMRAGTLARLYDDYFRPRDYPVEPFALAVAADSAGRVGFEATGDEVLTATVRRLERLRAVCAAVDAAALRERHGDDLEAFRRALHEARARAVAAADPPVA